MKKIVYLPLDERPCNLEYVNILAKNRSEFKYVSPSLDILGDRKIPANYELVKEFLLNETKDATYLIIAIDMLLYGGIVPSRVHHLTQEELLERLNVIKTIKNANPTLKIYGFSLIMRCPDYDTNEEEPDYYGTYGEKIYKYGELINRFNNSEINIYDFQREIAKFNQYEEYINDYTKRRDINSSIFEKLLKLTKEYFDKFIILQDDCHPYGFTAMERVKVKTMIGKLGLNVDVYPGADEGGLTLIAKALVDIKEYSPKFNVVYPKPQCRNVIPLYEDQEVYKTIKKQVESAGGEVVDSKDDADILLYANLPCGVIQNVMYPDGPQYDKRDLDAFVIDMANNYKKGKRIAIADIAYLNGGDIKLTKKVSDCIGLLNLSGYAGWNTSSNTLGTVICQSIYNYFYGNDETNKLFTALRVYEELGYMASVRKYIWDNEIEKMGYKFEDTKVKKGEVSIRITELINKFMKENYSEVYSKYEITDCYLPWKRMFEVGLTIKKRDN